MVGVLAVSWKFFLKPSMENAEQQAHEETIEETSGQSKYQHTVDLSLDPFSGYAIFRSKRFRDELARHAIRVRLKDDQADYTQRINDLRSGNAEFAVFTIDALLKASAQINDLPAVIICIIDETRGADAMVAAKSRFPNLDALNDPATRFVLTPDSPSETLARVAMSSFGLQRLSASPFEFTRSPEETVSRYRNADQNASEVYVLWEPFVSEILEDKTMHVIQDSSAFRGFIVDVLVVNRDYLRRSEPVVRQVLSSYLTAAKSAQGQMTRLVQDDATKQKTPLTTAQATKLVDGIEWKSTLENFAHFGLLKDSYGRQHIEDMIGGIVEVLTDTGAIASDPTGGEAAKLFNQRLLQHLQDTNFQANLDSDELKELQVALPRLTEQQWQQLREVGELPVPSLVFGKGTARLTSFSKATLDKLVTTLRNWPEYYLLVRGNASTAGNNPDANRRLAKKRAEATVKYLIEKGIHTSRLHAIGSDPSGTATTVSFVVGESK